ncbi:spore cortex biosynthesis protein YabQ [Paenibacillus lemnae]|uniref:Spore cortex biosynthesis protein YabQ n=1 Tax=Paenibacillus lemnae TaxID=1330551 RepID=A0A848MED2_PAELE|nr:spore cortex biosynthesis protein YabQ [Paenibacillus lemnae]NMO97754.1 spore cortex biosynthesis protein YabQ [Paenibacillus lemnae]
MNPHIQWITLLWMLFSGAAMGLAYDSYRVLSGELRFPRWSQHVLDFLYWVAAALFVFRMLYITNYGQLRFYVFVGLFLGVWIYFLLWSVITRRFVVMLIQAAKGLLSVLTTLLNTLLWKPVKGILLLLQGMVKLLWRMIMFLLRLLWTILTPVRGLLKWISSPVTSRLKVPAWAVRLGNKMKVIWKRWF